MEIEKFWYDDAETIFVEIFPEEFDMNDYCELIDSATATIEAKDYPVHIICDYGKLRKFPSNALACARYASNHSPANYGIVVFVNVNKWVSIFTKLAKDMNFKGTDRMYIADSMEEAMQLIYDYQNSTT